MNCHRFTSYPFQNVDIFIPTYCNSRVLKPLVENILATAKYPFHIYFIIEQEDFETVKELNSFPGPFTIIYNDQKGKIPHCFNIAYRQTNSNMIVVTCDDITFPDGWLRDAAYSIGEKGVLAFSDINGSGWGHFLIKREYIEQYSGSEDEPGIIFHEYNHEYADAEFQFTARNRGQIVYSPIAINHRDIKYFGAAVEEDGEVKPMVKTYRIRDYALPYSNIGLQLVANPNNSREVVLEITLIPRDPILIDKNKLNNVNKTKDARNTDLDEFLSRAHLWGGKIHEDLFESVNK